jgi:hypothetical protein
VAVAAFPGAWSPTHGLIDAHRLGEAGLGACEIQTRAQGLNSCPDGTIAVVP